MTATNQITKRERITGLDGLRAIVIILIALNHFCQQDFWYSTCPLPSLPLPSGRVAILFVLSGFLAGYYPFKTFDTKSFYLRKAKKLFPVYYSYIAIVIIAFLILGRSQEVLNLRLLYYVIPAGIVPFCSSEGILPLVHLWFITPIVLFYLVLPPLLKRIYGGQKQAIEGTIIISIAIVIIKWGLYLFVGKDTFAYRFINASQFDCILGGMALGLFLQYHKKQLPLIIFNKVTSCILWAIWLTSGFYANMIPSPCRNEFFGLLAAGLIICFVQGVSPIQFKAPIWHRLGKASYYIYIYHILVIILISELIRVFI